jgi:hypothetical protein
MHPKKPITPSRAEVAANRRARSAKLRVFERAAMPAPGIVEGSREPFADSLSQILLAHA